MYSEDPFRSLQGNWEMRDALSFNKINIRPSTTS